MTGRKLGLASDARTRFERGVDPAFLDAGLDLLTGLIVELCGGTPSEAMRAGLPPSEAKVIAFDPEMTAALGGVDVPADVQKRILESLDFAIDSQWNVTCPLRRHDIEGPADLVEEVVRIHGLDKVESVALPRAEGVARPTATPEQMLERTLRRAAAGAGLDEAITWSFISESEAAHVGGGTFALDNPISEDMKVMRPSLLPGLLSAVKRNVDRGATSLQLFEIGRRYLADGEKPTLTVALAGEKQARNWANGKPVLFDAYDAKAICMELLEAAGAPVGKLMVMPVEEGAAGATYHPGQSATLRLGPKNILASFGMLHPKTLSSFDVNVPVAVCTIHLDAIPGKRGAASFARAPYAPPALQSVTRDFAFLVPADLAAGDLLRAVKGADKKNIVDARVFDVFAGEGVPEGKKSIAIEVTLQPLVTSYKDAELKAISDAIVTFAAKQGAELRG